MLWAIHILEAADTTKAHELLKALAGGDGRAELTQQAKAVLGRLAGLDAIIKNPPAGVLELRLLPQPAAPGMPQPAVKPEEFQQYVKSLAEKGPQAAVGEADSFRWLQAGCVLPPTPFTAAHKGCLYVLLANRWPYMTPTDFVRRNMAWELVKARQGKDQLRLPAVEFELNVQVKSHLRLIPQSGQTAHVAVVVGEEVVSIVASSEALTAKGQIAGLFSRRRAQSLAAALRAGMRPIRTLLAASMNGELEQAKEILADWPELVGVRGRQPPFRDQQPLHAAVRGNHKEMVELLLARGADVNALGWPGQTPLHMAVNKGKLELVRLLLGKGADMRVADRQGLTALQNAAAAGNREMAEVLIAAGADVNAKGKAGMTPLAYAVGGWLAAGKDNPCVELLLAKGAKLDIFAAAALGKLDQIQAFLKADPDAAKATAMGRITPLHLAATAGHTDVAAALLDSGADVDAGRTEWAAPLTLAAGYGRKEIVKLLLERKADVNAVDADRGTPIASAAYQGWTDIVELLLDHGAELEPKDPRAAPLEGAVRGGQAQVVKLLLARGAKLKKGLLCELARASASTYGPHPALGCKPDFVGTAKVLIAAGADVNALYEGNTPLHLAADVHFGRKPDLELIGLLLDSGADVNAKGGQHRTPLHMAANSGNVTVAKLLLDAGADPFIEDDPKSVFAVRPVDEAKKWGDRTKAVVELLERHMAPRLEATKKAVEAAVWEFLLAVVNDDHKTIQTVTHDPPHMAKGIWPKWVQELRAEYAGQFDRLMSITASTARAGWAEVFVQTPLTAEHKYLVVFLMKFPDGKWRVLETSKTTQDLPQALGQRIHYARSQYQSFREKIFKAAEPDKGKTPAASATKERG
ncbi:MAG: hypothetical protein AMJ81_01475 [Phycisphaerae bacterium SM23_33]|nr:MAG: hypothetical protein AMJ81_01475 [Phycisphaerae bacterium SM23_33]